MKRSEIKAVLETGKAGGDRREFARTAFRDGLDRHRGHEAGGGDAAQGAGAAVGRQDVAGAGRVVAQGLGGEPADEDGAGGLDGIHQGLGIVDLDPRRVLDRLEELLLLRLANENPAYTRYHLKGIIGASTDPVHVSSVSGLSNGFTELTPNTLYQVSVAAFTFSDEAFKKIREKGEALTIPELMHKNPKAKGVRILG